MKNNTIEIPDRDAVRNDGGITLLEAYSALATCNSKRMPAVEIPFPGQPRRADPEGHFWKITLRNVS